MARPIRVYYDPEGDFLEVLFSEEPGFFRETDNESVLERVNTKGEVIGFSVLNVSHQSKDHPLTAELQ